jgi:hypothetical protein
VRTLAEWIVTVFALVTAGCTETPDYFPPCVYTAPCPADDGGDAEASAEAAVSNLADASVVDGDGDVPDATPDGS